MSRHQVKIELLSDLCVSDGGVYNSALDIDICHDRYGFPYIPAKRIKGCLRECAMELNEWGDTIPVEDLFGGKKDKEGNDYNKGRAKLRIGNALLENYDEMLQEAKNNSGNLIFHPQNVLDHFSYIRTQTSIDYETGAPDPRSLRTMRVANKGLTFFFDVILENEDDFEPFKRICGTLTNMGVSRTRGLGEIQVTVDPEDIDKSIQTGINLFPKYENEEYTPDSIRLDYKLDLDEPIICKSVNGGELKSLDYIEGSKILGLIVNELDTQEAIQDFLDDENELFCSNAYLTVDGERCLEVPANYFSIKNNHVKYLEKVKPELKPKGLDDEQLNSMKHCYIRKNNNGHLLTEDVDMEERYHHRRPVNKSIGRATGKDDSEFYYISSIEANQTFSGFITGTANQIAMAYKCLNNAHIAYLGYSHSSEYGKTEIRIEGMSKQKKERMIKTEFLTIKLEAPAIIYNERAFYSTDIEDLDQEIKAILGFTQEDVNYKTQYVNYTTVGGYNVTWKTDKPMIEAFDKGTVFIYQLKHPIEISMVEDSQSEERAFRKLLLIGERLSEGFGEATLTCIEEGNHVDENGREGILEKARSETTQKDVDIMSNPFTKELCDELFRDYVKTQATDDASKSCKDIDPQTGKPTVNNMLLMCEEYNESPDGSETDVFEKLESDINTRFDKHSENKNKKLDAAKKILEQVREKSKIDLLLDNFSSNYHVTGYKDSLDSLDKRQYESEYLKAFLQQLKYNFR